jgi:hypothetical protein
MWNLLLPSDHWNREPWTYTWMTFKCFQVAVNIICFLLVNKAMSILRSPAAYEKLEHRHPLRPTLIVPSMARFVWDFGAWMILKFDFYQFRSHPMKWSLGNIVPVVLATVVDGYISTLFPDMIYLRWKSNLMLWSDLLCILLSFCTVYHWTITAPRDFYGPSRLRIHHSRELSPGENPAGRGLLESLYEQQVMQRSKKNRSDSEPQPDREQGNLGCRNYL